MTGSGLLRPGGRVLVTFGISLAFLLALFSFVDLDGVLARVGTLSPQVVVAVLVLTILQNALSGWRWLACLRMLVPASETRGGLRVHIYAICVGQFMPGLIGVEIFKLGWAKVSGLSVGTVLTSIVQEKMVALLTLVAMMAAVLLVPHGGDPILRLVGWAGLVGLVGAIGLGHILATAPPEALRRFALPLRPREGRAGALFHLFAIALLANLLILALYALLWQALASVPLALVDTARLIPIVLLTTLPLSFGGWGVRETAFVLFFQGRAIPDEALVSIGLAFGVLQAAGAILGGGMALALPGSKQPGR